MKQAQKSSLTRSPRPKQRQPNRTKTLIRVVERKKRTIKNIRHRQKEKTLEIKKDKLLNKLANVLDGIICQK